jgi:hypothetical protein
VDHPEHQPAQGEQDMPEDDRRGQSAGGRAPASDIVFDQPDSQQIESEECGDEPADQGSNTHGFSFQRTQPIPGRGTNAHLAARASESV